MADASGSLSGGGSNTGLQMGRNRAHTKEQDTYLGEDNQTRPLEDLGNLLMGKYNQGRAQSNLAFGGRGYGNSFVPSGGGPANVPTNPAGPTGGPTGLGMKPQGGTIFPMMMRGGGGPNPYNPTITDGPTGPIYPGAPAYNPDQNNAEFGMGDYGDGVDYYTDPLDPSGDPSGGGDPDWTGGDPNGAQIDKGLHFNYLPGVDPNDGYFPRDPSILNDADNARPSPIRPQGASNDPWSTALTDGMDAPEGGLYSYLDQFASGQRDPYENAIGDELMNLYQNPGNEYDAGAADTFDFARTGGMTGPESQTRDYQISMANGDMLDPAWETRGGYADLWKGGPSSTEAENRALLLGALKDFGPGGAYDYGSGGMGYNASSGGGLGQAYSDALGGYEKVLGAPGRSDAEKAAIIGEGMRTARAGFDTARSEMERRQAITGNGAGFYDALAKIAGAQSNALGSTARQAQIDFANESTRQREDALRGLSGLANTEQAASATAAASANAAASRAAAMQQAQMQARLAGLGMLGNWDESQRKNQLAGLGGMERFDAAQNANRQYGITGMQTGDLDRSKRMMSGAAGLADLGQNTFGRKAGALGAANQWAQQGVDARKFGTQGLAGMWQQQNQYNNDDLDRLIRIYTNPREKYQESYYTKGQGGFGGTGTL